ncbi:MAG: PTS transporter subunit EIIC [Oribacterium sp.]|nr:PTS transporter subunit EIIC [Oribacterium sp.]
MMKYLQNIGKSLMLPIAVLPAAGILYGIGYWIDPTGWGTNSILSAFLIKAAAAIIEQIPLLFAIGVSIDIKELDHCATRIRTVINDYTLVDENAIKKAGIAGVIRPDKSTVQVIIGTKVQFVYEEMKRSLLV